jgi:hypothetical protein
VLGITTDVSDERTNAESIVVTPVAITTAPEQLLLCVTEPETIRYLPDPELLLSYVPELHPYHPSVGGAADADGVPTVSTEAANKKGNKTLKNFDFVNTGHSPTLYNQESRLAQLVTPKDHPETYLRSSCISC